MEENPKPCPRCDAEVGAEWSYCPYCGLMVDSGADQVATLSDRIRYVRREPSRRSRRNTLVGSLANLSIGVSVLLVVGGAVLLFHPALVPALFRPQESAAVPLPEDFGAGEAASERPYVLPFEWVPIPAGKFRFGPTGRTEVAYVPAFEILKHEVTNGQWYEYLVATGDYLKRTGRFKAAVPLNWGWEPKSTSPPLPPGRLWEKPVVYITWSEAQAFCTEYLSRRFPGARLPFGYEWEKAARGSEDDRPYPWGEEFMSPQGNWRCNVSVPGWWKTMNVDAFSRTDVSPYGVVGMGGNVSEYVGSVYEPAFRGGSFSDHPDDAKVYIETDAALGHEWRYVGFRAARPLPEGD